MPESITQRWTFSQPSPIGEVRSCYAMTAEGVQFSSDAAMHAGSEMLRWDAIVEAATAVVELPAGKGGPDMPRWMPGRLEWLVVSRSGEDAQAFMRPLPTAEARDAIVAAMRSRLGSRWVGERLSLEAARQRLGTPARGGSTMSVAWLVLTVLALLLALLMLVALLASVLAIPAEFALGAWSFHRGLAGLRDALHGLNTPASRVASAAMGFVKLEGRAVADRPSAAGVSGRPSVWWDVAVDVYDDSQDDGGWKQVAARHGGSADALVIEDETGRLPVWLRDADLLLQQHTWEPGQDALPAGAARCSSRSAWRATARGFACASGGWKRAGRCTSSERWTRRATCPPPATSAVSRERCARCTPAPGAPRCCARCRRSCACRSRSSSPTSTCCFVSVAAASVRSGPRIRRRPRCRAPRRWYGKGTPDVRWSSPTSAKPPRSRSCASVRSCSSRSA